MANSNQVEKKRRRKAKISHPRRELHIEGTPENIIYDITKGRFRVKQGAVRRELGIRNGDSDKRSRSADLHEETYSQNIPICIDRKDVVDYNTINPGNYFLTISRSGHYWSNSERHRVASAPSQKLDEILMNKVTESLKATSNHRLREDYASFDSRKLTNKILGYD